MKENAMVFLDLLKKNWQTTFKQIVAIIVTIITGIITFFIYSYFNRDKVNIESALVKTKDLQILIDLTLASKLNDELNSNSYAVDRSESSIYDLTIIDKDYLLLILKKLNDKSILLKKRINDLENDKNKLNELGNLITIDDIDKLNLTNYNSVIREFYDEPKKDTLKKADIIATYITVPVKRTKELKNNVDAVIKQLTQKTSIALEKSKERFEIEVIAFNEGNTQTVIRYKGLLELGSTQLNLKRADNPKREDYYTKISNAMLGKRGRTEGISNYIIIEPRSFIVLNLEIDNFNNKERDISVIKREYISGQSSVSLTLFDIKNNPIKPFTYKLQNDIDSDPNEILEKFIKDNLNNYIEPN